MSAVAEIVRAVSQRTELAHDDVGRIVGVSGRTVATWLRDSTPHQQARQRLLELSIVAERLDETLLLSPADAKVWLLSPNGLLPGRLHRKWSPRRRRSSHRGSRQRDRCLAPRSLPDELRCRQSTWTVHAQKTSSRRSGHASVAVSVTT